MRRVLVGVGVSGNLGLGCRYRQRRSNASRGRAGGRCVRFLLAVLFLRFCLLAAVLKPVLLSLSMSAFLWWSNHLHSPGAIRAPTSLLDFSYIPSLAWARRRMNSPKRPSEPVSGANHLHYPNVRLRLCSFGGVQPGHDYHRKCHVYLADSRRSSAGGNMTEGDWQS